jgi:hypothetical protein
MLRLPSVIAGLCAGLFAAPWLQDPVKPPPPPAEKPAEKPASVPAQEPVPGRPKPHALEGVYRLTARVLAGKRDAETARGYLAITNRHLFLCLAAPGTDPDWPLVRAGVRTWKAHDEAVATTIQLGWFTDRDGTLHVEKPGTDERRRIEFIQGGVRVVYDDRNWLEFERLE